MTDLKKKHVIGCSGEKYRITKVFEYTNERFVGEYKGVYVEINLNENAGDRDYDEYDDKWDIVCIGYYQGDWGGDSTTIEEAITEWLLGSCLIGDG